MCVHICVWVYVHMRTGAYRDQSVSYRLPAARILGGCEVPDTGGWEMNLGPLQEQQMLLTTEPALQHTYTLFKIPKVARDGSAHL